VGIFAIFYMTQIKEIEELLRKLDPILGDRAKGLWYLSQFSQDAKEVLENTELLRLLADKKAECDYKESIRLPPPIASKLSGEYSAGTVIYPDKKYSEFGLREDEFIKHLLITGMTGTGKTNLAFQILAELNKHNKPFLVFDWKTNYRALRQLPGFEDLKVVRLGSQDCKFKFNPLIPPPGINPRNWMAMLIDVCKHAFFFAHGVEYLFRRGIDYLYEQYDIYNGKTEYPTFIDLEKTLQKEYVRGREMLWMSSAKRTLASLTFSGLLGETLNVSSHEGIEELLTQNVVIEMDNLATIEKVFFIESLLLWIYHYKKTQSSREKFNHAIIIEEAHHVLSSFKEYKSGEENIIETIIRMIREFGESIIVVDQEPSKISNSILANTNCKICFNLGNGNDIKTTARCMNLTTEQERFIDKLKVGHAIVKMKERFSEPIHIRFPLMPIKKDEITTKSDSNQTQTQS